MIYLIRHAEKSLVGEQTLTKKGLQDAFFYGRKLSQTGIFFDLIKTSPVTRCVQTAEKIVEGMNIDIPIQESRLLGNPGIFVKDDQKAAKVFNQYSVCEVINQLIQNKHLEGFYPIKQASQLLIDEFALLTNQSILYISHDAIIMPFVAYINGITEIDEKQIVDFLQGYKIIMSERRVHPTHNIATINHHCPL
ncbi:MAG: histidine phosphatase family protein [Pseudomonadota bacterium]